MISVGQLDNGFLVVIEQIRKGQNELGYKNMYFEKGYLTMKHLQEFSKSSQPPSFLLSYELSAMFG